MNLERSVVDLFDRLASWAELPKHALERRLDVFLTPFVEEFLARELGERHPVKLVVPEFPILSEIRRLFPEDPRTEPARLEDVGARTVNADYLLHRGGREPAWILLELETDASSMDAEQLARYRAAQRAGMDELLRHLREKFLAGTDRTNDPRYRAMIREVEAHRSDGIEIVYVAPALASGLRRAGEALRQGDRRSPRCHLLSEFVESGPYDHAALWRRVRELLRRLDQPSPASAAVTRFA